MSGPDERFQNALDFDLDRLETEGPEVSILEGFDRQGLRGIQYEISARGDLVYRKGRRRSSEKVISWLLPGGELAPVVTKPGQYGFVEAEFHSPHTGLPGPVLPCMDVGW